MEATRKRFRLWPALVILALGAIAFGTIWALPLSHQQQNISFIATTFILFVLLLAWFIFASRAPEGARITVLVTILAGIVLGRQFFEVRGVTGDLFPIIERRSKSKALPVITGNQSRPTNQITVAGEFPQFYGPNRNAVLSGPQLQTNLDQYPPTILWRQPIGAGWSGFTIVNGRAVTQEQREQSECVVCYDLLTGQTLWSHCDQARYFTTIAGEGPRATPTIASNRVFTLGSTGFLNCLDLESGKLIWQKNILQDNNAGIPDWGLTGSPLIHEGKVIVNAGGPVQRSLVAYSFENGEFIWGGGSQSADYSSPMLFNLGGMEQILIFNSSLVSHDADNGKVLWEYPWSGGYPRVTAPLPVGSNMVLATSGYGVGAELIKVEVGRNSEWSTSRVWKSLALKSKFGTVFIYQDHIYGLDDGIFTCLELKTGQRKWKDGRYGHGQALLVNNLLLLTSEKGELVLIEPNPEKLLELSKMRVFEDKTWNPPALVGEYLLMRNHKEAACLKLAVSATSEKKMVVSFAKLFSDN